MNKLPDYLNLIKITERKQKNREAEEAAGITVSKPCVECGEPSEITVACGTVVCEDCWDIWNGGIFRQPNCVGCDGLNPDCKFSLAEYADPADGVSDALAGF